MSQRVAQPGWSEKAGGGEVREEGGERMTADRRPREGHTERQIGQPLKPIDR